MREQAADGEGAAGGEEDAFGEAAVVGLVMFEAEVRDVIAEGEEEVVVAIMTCAEEDAGFGDDVGEAFLDGGRDGERGFTVGDEVELVVDGLAGGREVDDAVVLAFDDGRVDEEVEGDGLKGDVIAGLGVDGEGGAEFPAVGEDEGGAVGELGGGRAGGVEGDFVPLEDEELVGGGEAGGLDVVVGGVEVGDAGGDVEVEGVDVEEVALPGDFFSFGSEVEAGEAGDGAVGAVLAGDPLGVVEGEGSGVDGDGFADVEDFFGGVGGVDGEGDGGLGEGCGGDEGGEKAEGAKVHARAPSEEWGVTRMIQGLIVPGPFALVASLARLEGASKTNLLEPLKVAAGGKNERRSRFRYFSAAPRPIPLPPVGGSFDCAPEERVSRWKLLLRRFAQDDTFVFMVGIRHD